MRSLPLACVLLLGIACDQPKTDDGATNVPAETPADATAGDEGGDDGAATPAEDVPTPEDLCKHEFDVFHKLEDASGPAPSEKISAKAMAVCIDEISAHRGGLGEEAYAKVAICTMKAEDLDAIEQCHMLLEGDAREEGSIYDGSAEAICEHLLALEEKAEGKPFDDAAIDSRLTSCVERFHDQKKSMGEHAFDGLAVCVAKANSMDEVMKCEPGKTG